MADFFYNERFNKMADYYLNEIRQKNDAVKGGFKQMVKDQATQEIADNFHLTYQEAEDALVVIHSKQSKLANLRFPITTAGLRKLAYTRTGALDCVGERVIQCVDPPFYFVDWVFQKMNLHSPFVEFGVIRENHKWRRCESTGMWFFDKKPPLTCDIELCTSCQPFFPVYETIKEVELKFFYWDKKVKSYDCYTRYYAKFYEIAKKKAIVLDFDSPELKYMYSMRVFRLMVAKRYATGDLHFRYCIAESYVKDYLDAHHRMLDQLADLPINQSTQIVNTCLNDTIVMATEEEVARWIKDYLNNHRYLPDLEGSLDFSGIAFDALPIRIKLLKDTCSLSAPWLLRNHVEAHGDNPDSLRFCSSVEVHRDIPVGSRVSRIRLLEYFQDTVKKNSLALEEHKGEHIYVFTKVDWYLPIPAFVKIESAAQLEEVWEDGEEEDGCYIRLLHDFSKKSLINGEEVIHHKKGDEIYVNLEQMDNHDDYPWEIFNSDREIDVYLFRVEVGEMLRASRNQKSDTVPEGMIRVEIWKEFGAWHGQYMDLPIAKEIFETPWEELVHTSPCDYKW